MEARKLEISAAMKVLRSSKYRLRLKKIVEFIIGFVYDVYREKVFNHCVFIFIRVYMCVFIACVLCKIITLGSQ